LILKGFLKREIILRRILEGFFLQAEKGNLVYGGYLYVKAQYLSAGYFLHIYTSLCPADWRGNLAFL
jgi:hypothetical protein